MSGKKLFVGGLAWATTEATLREAFEKFGQIEEVNIVKDHSTGKSRGFGFVLFSEEESAESACKELNDTDLDGRTIKVDIAKEKTFAPKKNFRQGGRSNYNRD